MVGWAVSRAAASVASDPIISLRGVTKTYDGTTAATGATVAGNVVGAINGDTLSLDTSGITLAYNNARQSAITQELAEITGGAEAIK